MNNGIVIFFIFVFHPDQRKIVMLLCKIVQRLDRIALPDMQSQLFCISHLLYILSKCIRCIAGSWYRNFHLYISPFFISREFTVQPFNFLNDPSRLRNKLLPFPGRNHSPRCPHEELDLIFLRIALLMFGCATYKRLDAALTEPHCAISMIYLNSVIFIFITHSQTLIKS